MLKSNKPRDVIELLDVYGPNILRWPEGRAKAFLALLTSAAFRQNRADALSIEKAVASTIPPLQDGLEARLLSRMGIEAAQEYTNFGVNPFQGGAVAAASLCLGLAIGAVWGDVVVPNDGYAGVSEEIWLDIDADFEAEDVS